MARVYNLLVNACRIRRKGIYSLLATEALSSGESYNEGGSGLWVWSFTRPYLVRLEDGWLE